MWKSIRHTPLAGLGLAAALCVQPVAAESLNLRQAAEAVLQQNPEINLSRARIEQAASGLKQADGAGLPRVNLSLTATRTNDALSAFGLKLGQERISAADFAPAALNDPKDINNLNTRIEMQAPLYTGGQIQARQAEAKAHVRAAQAGDEAARQRLLLDALRAYQSVHLARAYREVAAQSQKTATEYVRVTENLHKQGMAVKSDRLSARVNLEDAGLRQREAQRLEANALDQLKLLMGRPLGDSIDVAEESLLKMPAGHLDDLRAQALNLHPTLQALRSQVEAAGESVNAARGAKKPQISALARQDWNDKGLGLDATSYTLAGVLTWNAFDGGFNDAAIDRAQAARLEHTARLRQAEDGIAFQVTDAYRRAEEAEARITAREAALQDAEEAQRLTQIRYQNGVTTLVDLFNAQAQLDKARAGLAQARYDRSLARGELLHAAGLLSPELF
mgnify:CR=1 FL=1